MEITTVSSKGQITIPQNIRLKMNLKKGDRIMFFEENGKFFLKNTASIGLRSIQQQMQGKSEKSGLKTPDDVVEYIKSIRTTS
jgi:AbrB family looped-hinge helix DNA binding protein